MRALLSLLFLAAAIGTSAQFPHSASSNRVLQKVERTLATRFGAATFRRHFYLDREASYRVFVDEGYKFLDNEGDPGLPVYYYQFAYHIRWMRGRDTVFIGTILLRCDSNGRLQPRTSDSVDTKRALAAWQKLLTGKYKVDYAAARHFQQHHRLERYRVLFQCDTSKQRWYWTLEGPPRPDHSGRSYDRFRIDPATGRWQVEQFPINEPPIPTVQPDDGQGPPAMDPARPDSLRQNTFGKQEPLRRSSHIEQSNAS